MRAFVLRLYRRPLRVDVTLVALACLTALQTSEVHAQATDKSGVRPQVIKLPTGPGSVEGLGSAFEPMMNTGTAHYAVPLTLPAGVGGLAPTLQLSYDAGSGNGPFGLGWSIAGMAVQRQTDEGLPGYGADDTFVDGAGSELVPVGGGIFRSEVEGQFVRYRMLGSGANVWWEATERNGRRWLLGETVAGRQSNISGTFAWLAQRWVDTNDNEVRFFYHTDGGRPYLDEIRYNIPRGRSYGEEPLDRIVRVRFEYEQRPDAFDNYLSRARVSTAQRVRAIETTVLGRLTRRYELTYDDAAGVSLLTQVRALGADLVRWEADPTRGMPPLILTYQEADPQEAATVPVTGMGEAYPPDLRDPNVDMVDINGDSLPDVVHTAGDGHRFYLNRGRRPGQSSRWAPEASRPQSSPSNTRLDMPEVQVADMNGDALADLVVKSANAGPDSFYYYPNRGGGVWESAARTAFSTNPSFKFVATGGAPDPNTQLADLDHDKRVDVVVSAPDSFQVYYNRPTGWSAPDLQPMKYSGAALRFSASGVSLADMNGDGLDDLVLQSDVAVTYFPGMGLGAFDAPITMSGAPNLTGVAGERRLGDVDGDGASDLLFVRSGLVQVWPNRWGRGFAAALRYAMAPTYDQDRTALRLADMDGDGAVDLLYSTSGTGGGRYRYLRFVPGPRNHLLTAIANGLGRTIRLEYKTSTDYYVDDWDAGRPWSLRTPVPVTVVARSTVFDAASGQTYVSDYSFRNAYYDPADRAFRGFSLSAQVERGDATAPTLVTRRIFDTGATQKSRKGMVLQEDILAESATCGPDTIAAEVAAATSYLRHAPTSGASADSGRSDATGSGCYRRTIQNVDTRALASGSDGRQVMFSAVDQVDTLHFEGTATPRRTQQRLAYDVYGNQTLTADYGEVAVDGGDPGLGGDERIIRSSYAVDPARWILDRVAEQMTTDLAGTFAGHQRSYYDGAPFVGLPLGRLDRGNLARREVDTGPADPNRHWVQEARLKVDTYGNVVARLGPRAELAPDGTPRDIGHTSEVTLDDTFHQFPVLERIRLGSGKQLVTTAEYDLSLGVITSAREFNGHALSFGYDGLGRLTSVVKPGDSTQFPTQRHTYTLGAPVSSVMTENRLVSGDASVYRSVSFVDGLGRTIQTRASGEDNKVVVGAAVTFNARGTVAAMIEPYFAPVGAWAYTTPDTNASRRTATYDPLGRQIRTTNTDGTFVESSFGPLEQSLADEEDTTPSSPHANTPTTIRMDGLGRVVSVRDRNGPDVYTTAFEYDTLDNVVRTVDTLGNVRTQAFDALKRRLELLDPDRGRLSQRFDDAGNIVLSTDAKGQSTEFSYDGMNRPLAENWIQSPGDLTPEIRFHYDADVSAEYSSAANTLGRLAWVEDASGREYVSYDARGNPIARIKRITGTNRDFVTRVSYDAFDRPVGMTYPDGTSVDYVYSTQNTLDAISGFVSTIDYDATGKQIEIETADGVTTRLEYDERRRLTDLTASGRDGTRLQAYHYAFDGANNIVRIDDLRPDRTSADDDTRVFTLDDLYRLTSAEFAATGQQVAYAYDAIGNMVRKTSNVASEQLGDLRYGQNGAGPHLLTEVAGRTWRYDANANLTTRAGANAADRSIELTWDYRNRLTRLTGTDGLRQENAFDHANRRVRKHTTSPDGTSETWYPDRLIEKRGSQLVKYVFAGNQRIADVRTPYSPHRLIRGFEGIAEPHFGFDAGADGRLNAAEVAARDGDVATVDYVEVNDALTLLLDPPAGDDATLSLASAVSAVDMYRARAVLRSEPLPTFYHPDHLGSTTLTVDSSGTVVGRASYFPYGTERKATAGAELAHRFAGKELDREARLYDYGARFYDPMVGRFISYDPLSLDSAIGLPRPVRGTNDDADAEVSPRTFQSPHPYSDARLSPFMYANANPIRFEDADGRDATDRVHAARGMLDIKYRQEGNEGGLRTSNTQEALEYMDCSELVSRVLAADKVTDGVLDLSSSKLKSLLDDTTRFEHSDRPQVGDIAVWDGHVGVVTEVNGDKFKLAHARGEGKLSAENRWFASPKQYRDSEFFGFYRPKSESSSGSPRTLRWDPNHISEAARRIHSGITVTLSGPPEGGPIQVAGAPSETAGAEASAPAAESAPMPVE